MRINERGEHVFGNLTATGRRVIGNLTDAARFVFGMPAGNTYDKTGGATADLEAGGSATRKRRRKKLIFFPAPARYVRPSYKASDFVAPISKAGGSRLGTNAAGTKQIERIRAGRAVAMLRASGESVSAYAEHELLELFALGALTLDDLFDLDAPDYVIEDALALA